MYPAAPATMQPTTKPTMILAFFKKGDPNNSVRMMATNDRKPSPMNSGEPHNKGRGAKMVGHIWKIPVSGRLWQSLEPPPQLRTPDSPIREAPIMMMTVPVTANLALRRMDGTRCGEALTQGRENLLQCLGADEGKSHVEEGADHRGAFEIIQVRKECSRLDAQGRHTK